MPYMVKRYVAGLDLKVGDTLDYEKGSLPAALKFDAVWVEPKPEEPKPAGKRTAKK